MTTSSTTAKETKLAQSLRSFYEANKEICKKGSIFAVPVKLILEEPGFNVRDYEDAETKAHIRNLADAYLRGDDLPPLFICVRDGKIYVREGHCRRLAIDIAIAEGAPIETINVIEVKGDIIHQTLLIAKSSNGLELSPIGRSELYMRLVKYNLSEAHIAKEVGKTVTHVKQHLALFSLPIELKAMIKAKQVSWTNALETFNDHGTKAIGILEALAKANPEPATLTQSQIDTQTIGLFGDEDKGTAPIVPQVPRKIRPRDVAALAGYRSSFTKPLVKAVTDSLDSLVEKLKAAPSTNDDQVMLTMSKADVEALLRLHADVKPKVKDASVAASETPETAPAPETEAA